MQLVASRPIAFNNTGTFGYADTVEYEEGFLMTGNVTVMEQGNNIDGIGNFDTAGALMVPSTFVRDSWEYEKWRFWYR